MPMDSSSVSGGEPPPSNPDRRAAMLTHPYWIGIAGIAAVLAIVVAVVLAFVQPSGPAPSNQISGDAQCAAQGNDNQVECKTIVHPQPTAVASVGVNSQYVGGFGWVFDGDASELGRPPAYDPNSANNHCDEWNDWIWRNKRMYGADANFMLEALAGQPEPVAVNLVALKVFSEKPYKPNEVTRIHCKRGGGLGGGYNVQALLDGTARVSQFEKDETFVVPPASVTIDSADYQSVMISPEARAGTLYTGLIEVNIIQGGASKKLFLGSEQEPLRWLVWDDQLMGAAYVDYDFSNETWGPRPRVATPINLPRLREDLSTEPRKPKLRGLSGHIRSCDDEGRAAPEEGTG